MNIELDVKDFGLLWHTACDTSGLEIDEDHGFDWVKGNEVKDFNLEQHTYYMYWVGKEALQAIVALQILQDSGYNASLLWDGAGLSDDDLWGYAILTNKPIKNNS